MSKKAVPLYTLIVFGIIIAIITAVAVLLLERTLPLPLVGEASSKYQVGGYTGPLPTYVNETKLFCDKVNNCGLVPPGGGSLKVIDADGKEVGIFFNRDWYDINVNLIDVFDININKFLTFNMYTGQMVALRYGSSQDTEIYNFQREPLWFETTDCTGKTFANIEPINPYTVIYSTTNRFFTLSNYTNISFPFIASGLLGGVCGAERIDSTFGVSLLEPFQVPTYRGPLRIVVR